MKTPDSRSAVTPPGAAGSFKTTSSSDFSQSAVTSPLHAATETLTGKDDDRYSSAGAPPRR